MARLGDFVVPSDPIGPEARGAEVYDRFQDEQDTLVIAVVDADQRPIGLVERNAFILKMAAVYGRDLYANRPASTFMNAQPVIVDAEADAEALFESIDSGSLHELMNGFLVTKHGLYAGVGAGLDVLRAGNAIHKGRAEAMASLARDLARAEQEARSASRAKSEFLAVMSHEIRTPLNGVLGVAALMERELVQEDLRPYVDTILASGQSLLRLLTDALDMSRAEAGQVFFETAPVSLKRVANALEGLWTPRAEEKRLMLDIDCDGLGCEWVIGDEVRLKQLLNNLIGNALKFTKQGGVSVNLVSSLELGGVEIVATIDDSGPGIPESAVDTIFNPFNTGEAGREGAGAGLGLTICQQIVEGMGGTIQAGRSPKGGARIQFSFALPASDPAADIEGPAVISPMPHETLHVLVVDDNATNRFVASKVLELFGCTSSVAENGAEAVSAVQAETFDLVLMDVKMPVMDGVTATRRIRNLPGAPARLPILALTANADPHDADEYIAAGMNGVVQKPLQPDVLLFAMRRALSDGCCQANSNSSPPRAGVSR